MCAIIRGWAAWSCTSCSMTRSWRTCGSEGWTAENLCVSQPIEVETPDGCYRTLGYTDHMIFLMLHLIKHFILTGMSLRMMLDVALFFSRHAERIDSARFWKTMESLKYGTIAQSILWAMVRYCGIDATSLPGLCEACPKQVGMILDDLESGGWLGKIDEKAREEGWYEYNRQLLMKNRSKAQYLLFMLHWKIGAYLKALFPSRKTLAIRYPCVRKHAALIPFVWLHRLVFRGSQALKNGALTSYIVTDEKRVAGRLGSEARSDVRETGNAGLEKEIYVGRKIHCKC